MGEFIDLTGQVFGRLTVIKRVPSPSWLRRKRTFWLCKCGCGNETKVEASNLKSGRQKSCGCYKIDKSATINGLSAKYYREYTIWSGIIKRCTNPNAKDFRRYGGRGISVCQRWVNSFADFLNDMGSRPIGEPNKIHIDRIDNRSGYEPDNCRWTTAKNNAQNRIDTVWIVDPFDGETLCKAEISRKYGLKPSVLHDRLKYNWPIQKALTTPVKHCKPKDAKI